MLFSYYLSWQLAQSCQTYINQATSSLKQAQLDRRAAQNQVQQSRDRQAQISALVDQGAIARNQLEKINQQLSQHQAQLSQATATEQKALDQLRSLRKMSVCAAPKQAYGKMDK
ncbi:MAG: hypothetical protein SFT94_08975 [Pseudanabaenaceae cyanobacterium bins.68]|nr:hypothetical protein [Pseudanabaenaceae cyanobacterium bins.68]